MRKRRKKRSKILWIPVGILVFLGVAILLLATMNIACDFVASEAQEAVKSYLQADLQIDEVEGNPLRGYTILGVNLSKDGQEMFKAEFVEAKVNFMSLLSSPRLSLLSIGGVNMDLDKFVEEFNKLPSQPSEQPTQIPIDEIKLVQSKFVSQWGSIEVDDVSFGFDQFTITAKIKGRVNALEVAGTIAAEVLGTQVSLKNLDLKAGKGSIKATGQLSEALNVQGAVEGADLTELASLWSTLNPEDFVGAIGLSFNATGTWLDPVFSATADYKGARLAGWPVESFDGMVNYKEMRLSLDKITANALGIPLSGNAAMAFREDIPTVFFQLKGGEADLASLTSLGGVSGITGNISEFNVDIKGPTNALSGTIHMQAPAIGGWGVRGTDVALQIKLTGGNQAIVNGKAQFQGAASYLSGSVLDILTGPKLDLTLKTVDLNLAAIKPLIPDADALDPKGNVTAEIHIKGTTSNPSLDGTINSKSLTAAGYTADNIALGFSYAQNNFTLKESTASWTGLPIKASGTVVNVMAARPTIDIDASLSFTPATLSKFVPDIDQYKLKGTIQVGIHAIGALQEPKLDLVISSQELDALDIINAKNIRATTALAGDLTKLENMDLNISAQSVSASGLGFQNVGAEIKKTGDTINLVSAKASSGQGSLSGSGTVTTPASGTGNININVDMAQLSLQDLSKTGNLGVDLAGTFSGKLNLTGNTDAPTVAFQGSAPKISVNGYGADNLTIGLSGAMTDLKLDNLSAQIGAGKLSATGNIKPSDGTGQINFTGAGLDLAKLTESVPDIDGQITGILSVNFNATLSGAGASGQGAASAPSLNIYGMKLTDVSLPLSLSGNSFKFGQGAAKLNGGTLSINGDVDINTLRYNGKLNASGVDVNALIHDLVPDIKGKITGAGVLDVTIAGTIEPKFTMGGTGQAKVGVGSLSGFTWIDLISRLHGVSAINYTDVTAPFVIETTRMIFQKGTKATAPNNDPLYKYAQIEGPLTYAGGLNLTGDGNINFQLINILAGGALGAAGAVAGGNINQILSGQGLEAVLTQAIGRGAVAGQHNDFRDVSFKVGGTIDDPAFSIVKVGPSTLPEEKSAEPQKQQPQNIQEAVKDRVLDSLGIPTRQQEEPVKDAEPKQPQEAPKEEKQPQKKPEDIVKEEAGKAIRNLIRR